MVSCRITDQFRKHKLSKISEDTVNTIYCLPEERSWFEPIAKRMGFVPCN